MAPSIRRLVGIGSQNEKNNYKMFFSPRYMSDDDVSQPGWSRFYAASYESVSQNGVTAVRRGINDNGKVSRDGYVVDSEGKTHQIDYDKLPGAKLTHSLTIDDHGKRKNHFDDRRASRRGDDELAISSAKHLSSDPGAFRKRKSVIDTTPFNKWPFFNRRHVASTDVERGESQQKTPIEDVPHQPSK